MGYQDLKSAIRSKDPDSRFAAAFVIGEKGLLGWQGDLIPLLNDKIPLIRQAARRSLIILSFLELNNKEDLKRLTLSRLKKPVDFGPSPIASFSGRKKAMQKWSTWWKNREKPLIEFNDGAKLIR